jgi:WD40 repeat protein/tRNA A-37 threonylcarbamoyl transferase component Bud32
VSAALDPAASSVEARLARLKGAESRRYTRLGEVAQGGMGRILRVWDERLGREVAMKVVARELPADAGEDEQHEHERRLARFVDEARITAQLDHPSIVPVYEIGLEPDGSVFFTMPLVRGEHLGKIFEHAHAGRDGWSLARVVDVLHKVSLTLAFAHARGVVHRDLKPENVMVGPFGEIYVMDWGLALLVGKQEREGIVGTPAYMSPEQASGKIGAVGPRSDVYSLGALLYEYFARRRPHESSLDASLSTGESFDSVLARPPRPLRELAPDVPRELEAIAAHAMRHEPAERYADARALADDLAAWLEGRVVSALVSGPWTRLVKWRARNAALARALDALLLLLVAGGAAFVLKERAWRREVEAKSREALLGGYQANLAAADMALRAGETSLARHRLAQCDADLRGFEWRHLALRADMSLAVLPGNGAEVRALAATRDGARFASGAEDGRILLWDAAQRKVERILASHTGPVLDLAFAPDGTKLASVSQDDRVLVWDLATEAPPRELANRGVDVRAVAIAPDGLRVAWGDMAGVLVVAELASGSPVAFDRPERKDEIVALAYLPGRGDLVAAYATGLVKRLDSATLVELASAHPSRTGVQDLSVAPGGDELALACGTTLVRLTTVDLATRASLGPFARHLRALEYSPDGHELATCAHDEALRLWDVERGIELETFLGHADDLNDVAFLGASGELVSASNDSTLRLWSRAGAAARAVVDGKAWLEALALAPDGTRALVASRDKRAKVLTLAGGAVVAEWSSDELIDCVAWSTRGDIALGCGAPEVRLVRAEAPAEARTLPGAERPATLAFDGAGARLFVRDARGALVIHELASSAPPRVIETGVSVTPNAVSTLALAVSRDGRTVCANLAGGRVGSWNADDGRALATWTTGDAPITALAIAPDDRRLAVGHSNGQVELCRLHDGAVLARFEQRGTIMTSLAFDPSGTRLVAGASDKLVHLWNLETLEPLLSLRAHEDTVTGVAFTPDGRALVSSSKDGSLRLWRTARDVTVSDAAARVELR